MNNERANGVSKTDRNQYINSVIKAQRPELTLKENPHGIKDTLEICLLPYINPALKDEETIEFQYTNEIYDENYWGKHEIIFYIVSIIHPVIYKPLIILLAKMHIICIRCNNCRIIMVFIIYIKLMPKITILIAHIHIDRNIFHPAKGQRKMNN